MSRTFSMTSGSSEILKDATTCGCNPQVRQMRPTVEAQAPAHSRIEVLSNDKRALSLQSEEG